MIVQFIFNSTQILVCVPVNFLELNVRFYATEKCLFIYSKLINMLRGLSRVRKLGHSTSIFFYILESKTKLFERENKHDN